MSRFITTDTNGYKLIAAFDVAENEVGKEISGIRIRHIDELEAFCEENSPRWRCSASPVMVHSRSADGWWIWASRASGTSPTMTCRCRTPEVVVENVHLGDSLMSLGYRLRNQE